MESPADHYQPNLQHNLQSLHYLKSTISSVAGATSGLLGLTNASGFLFYTLTSILAGVAFSLINCRRAPGLFFVKGGREVALSGLLDNLFPFVLFWTLFYALVHIYD